MLSLSCSFIVIIRAKLPYKLQFSFKGSCCIDCIDWGLMLVRYRLLFQLFYSATSGGHRILLGSPRQAYKGLPIQNKNMIQLEDIFSKHLCSISLLHRK